MNPFKTFIRIIPVLLLGISCRPGLHGHFHERIGQLSDGVASLTLPANTIKAKWETWLSSGGQAVSIDASSIWITADSADGGYVLMARDISGLTKLAVPLRSDKGYLYEAKADASGASRTVLCSGSAEGCNPKDVNTPNPWCTGCSGGCTKTVTVTSGGRGIFQ